MERILRLPVAMRDTKVFLKLLQLELAAHPPGAPVTKVWIAAEPAPPRSAQRGLFLPITPEAEEVGNYAGPDRRHRGRAAGGNRASAGYPPAGQLSPGSLCSFGRRIQAGDYPVSHNVGWRGADTISFAHVSPAMAVAGQAGRRTASRFDGHDDSNPSRRTAGKVLWSAGPWRSSGDWWTENAKAESASQDQTCPWDREEWDVALANGTGGSVALYCIYRDLASGQWFAEASYD